MGDDNAQNHPNGCTFDHSTDCFKVVKARLLVKTFRHKASFIPGNRVIERTFDTKHPFESDDILR